LFEKEKDRELLSDRNFLFRWISIPKLVVEGVVLKQGQNIHGTFPVINEMLLIKLYGVS
jgi:hypothetical protein